MAVEKGKVIAALEAEYKGKKSLSKHFIDSLASIAAEEIEDDAGIGDYINNQKAFINLTIAENDRRANEAIKRAKLDAAAAISGEGGTDNPAPQPEPDTEIGKLMKMVGALTETVTQLKSEKQAESIETRFKKLVSEHADLKGLPEFMLKGRVPAKDEDIDTALSDLVADFKPYAEQHKLAGFGNDTPPGSTGGKPANKKEASKEELDAVVLNLV